MKTREKAYKEKHGFRDKSAGSQLNRRNFLKLFGAAFSGGTLLSSTPVLANNRAKNRLKEFLFNSNSEELFWRMVRKEFALKEELIHMNTGTLSSISYYVLNKLSEYNQILAEDPYPTAYYYPFSLQDSDEGEPGVHSKAAAFPGADEGEIVVTNCTTEGMSFVAMGLNLQPGDEVLTTMHEHPGGYDCWRILREKRGITLTSLPFQDYFDSKQDIVDLFESAITPNTKVMSFCHINYTTGLKMPVKELCTLARDNGIISVVDGAHAMGMLNLDIHDLGCDFYTCSPQKWLCAPPGVGVLYIRDGIGTEGDLIEEFYPTVTEMYNPDYSFQYQLEFRGQQSSPVWVCLKDAIDFQISIGGKDIIENRIMSLSTYAKARLLEIPGVKLHCSTDPEQSSGLVSFYIKDQYKGHSKVNYKIRDDYRIIMRTVTYKDNEGDLQNKQGLRISTHIYNNYDQIDLLAQAIEENIDLM